MVDPKIWQAGMDALIKSTPLLGPSLAAMTRAARESEVASESNDIDILTTEETKQRIELSMAEMQAKVAQEVAIAKRIEDADEVHIEEYYEGETEGNLGFKNDATNNISLGIGGKKSRVTKRIFKFKKNKNT